MRSVLKVCSDINRNGFFAWKWVRSEVKWNTVVDSGVDLSGMDYWIEVRREKVGGVVEGS